MKIIIFTENNHCGGMDTFYPTLINYWPYEEDEFVFICNKSHPGLINIKKFIKKECEVIAHDIPLNWTISKKLFGWLPNMICRATQPFLRILILPLQISKIRKLFSEVGGDRLLVVNGGYPGGESCRVANIVWHKMGRERSVHNIRNFAILPRPFFGLYEYIMDNLLLNSVSHFVGVSIVCAESLRIRKQFKHKENIRHIYNGLDLNVNNQSTDINLREELVILKNAPLCLMLATYELRKGYEFLFKVIEKVRNVIPDVCLVICGDGTEDEIKAVSALQNKITPKSNTYLHGFVAGGRSLIKQADVFLIASQEFESFGWTAIESMLAEIPVVSTNVGGLPEVIGEDGVCGYCVNRDDVETYATKIIDLLQSRELREEMGRKGKERVNTIFAAPRMVEEYADLIRGDL